MYFVAKGWVLIKYEYLLDPSFKRLIESQVFKGDLNKDFQKLVLMPENLVFEKGRLSFTLNLQFMISRIL